MRFSPRPVLVAFSAGTLLFTACASGSESDSSDALPAVATDAASDAASFNDADVVFAQSMIPHHREAVGMAEMALAPAAEAGAEVQALATQIQAAQDPEIEQMTSLLESWGQPLVMEGMDASGDMEGMEGMADTMSAEDMASLSALSGPDFDRSWSSAMIVHHEGAVSMAQTVKASGSNTEVLELADAVIAGQQVEIDQMKALIGS